MFDNILLLMFQYLYQDMYDSDTFLYKILHPTTCSYDSTFWYYLLFNPNVVCDLVLAFIFVVYYSVISLFGFIFYLVNTLNILDVISDYNFETTTLHECLSSYKSSFLYVFTSNYSFVFTLKLVICLVFLSAIRGGVPRYRYDFLTKIGWVKFLGLVLSSFLIIFSLFII